MSKSGSLLTGQAAIEAAADYPQLQRFLEYWDSIRGQRPMPARADFSPNEIPELLQYLWLADVLDNGADYFLRVVGTRVEDAAGRSLTKKALSELPDDEATNAIRNNLDTCRQRIEPVFQSGTLLEPGRDYINFASLTLPLSGDGESVNMVLSVMTFTTGN